MRNRITKKQLIEQLALNTRTMERVSESWLNQLIKLIYKLVKEGYEVNISGFGKFTASKRSARSGVDPRTGKRITIPALTTPKFVAGQAFKDTLRPL